MNTRIMIRQIKQIIYILIPLILMACGQSSARKTSKKESNESRIQHSENDKDKQRLANNVASEEDQTESNLENPLGGFHKATLYKLSDTIKADFNGDGFMDCAIYKKIDNNSGILILHGNSNELTKIGFGKSFSIITDFNWIQYWGLVEDKETDETTFSEESDVMGSRKVELRNPSIVIGEYDIGGGLITFINGRYVWIHQTC